MLSRVICITAGVICLLMVTVPTTHTAPPRPEIWKASADSTILTIAGANFGADTPAVTFAGTTPLTVTGYNPATGVIVADMPAATAAGNYLLEVTDERGRTESFVLTVFP